MGISTPTQIAKGTGVASGATVTTTVDAPKASLIVVAVLAWQTANSAITGLTDSAGNTYTQAIQSVATATVFASSIWYCSNTPNDLPIGGTLTATTAGGTYGLFAYVVTGCNGGADKTNTTLKTSGNNKTFSLATGTLTVANELIFGAFLPGASTGVITESAGFSSLDNTASFDLISYKIANATGTVTWSPSWATNLAIYSAVLASFESTPSKGQFLALF